MFSLPTLRRLVVLSLIALSAALVAPMGATAAVPFVFPPGTHPFGKSYGEWSAAWWKQAYASPVTPGSPFATGAVNCTQLGQGNVVFLVGTTPASGPVASRSCDVPAGTALLIPLIDAECSLAIDKAVTYPARLRCARDLMDAVDRRSLLLHIGLHGSGLGITAPPVLLSLFRVDSPPFTWTSVDGNAFGVDPYTDNPAAANGFFVMLAGLPRGQWDVSLGGAAPSLGFSTQANYVLTVR